MITLYGWGPMFDCPSPSPYVMKTEIHLQMLGVAFERAIADLDSVPKHKAPYVRDGETLIEDSNFIRAYFEKKCGRALDDGLSNEHKAASWALERMAEEHLTKVMAMERWLKDDNFNKGPILFFQAIPEPARAHVAKEVRDGVAAGMHANGVGRHSESERMALAARDIDAIAAQLDDQPFLFGDEPTVADAAVSAVLLSCATEFFNTPLTGLVREHANLAPYMGRIRARFFASNEWPGPLMA